MGRRWCWSWSCILCPLLWRPVAILEKVPRMSREHRHHPTSSSRQSKTRIIHSSCCKSDEISWPSLLQNAHIQQLGCQFQKVKNATFIAEILRFGGRNCLFLTSLLLSAWPLEWCSWTPAYDWTPRGAQGLRKCRSNVIWKHSPPANDTSIAYSQHELKIRDDKTVNMTVDGPQLCWVPTNSHG